MLGTDLMTLWAPQAEVFGCDLHNCNILDQAQVEQLMAEYRPQLVIHAAAYTNVDQAEAEPALAIQVNADGAAHVAAAARTCGARFVYLSTDYVFDGLQTIPYTETDRPQPLGAYGISKLSGEQRIQEVFADAAPAEPGYLIVRTAWLYGKHGKNFVATVLRLAREHGSLRIVHDQTGAPTYTRDLARGILALCAHPTTGIYHFTNDGVCTWYEFAQTILEFAGLTSIPIQPMTTQELQRPAPRPKFSVLDLAKFAKLTGQRPRHWKQGLQEYFAEFTRET
jgi:dTDP-4-dehydrorhamnose reductase